MKVAAYTALCYGSPYLEWAIRSVIDYADEYIVLYSEYGSHSNHRNTNKPASESRQNLQRIVKAAAGDKARWVDGSWLHEGHQRDDVWNYTDADIIIVLDYDELWNNSLIHAAKAQYSEAKLIGCSKWRVPMIHFWRSFKRAIIDDNAYPIRVLYRINHTWKQDYSYLNDFSFIAHLGYAIPSWLMEYKWSIHGHIAELRPDWYETKWQTNAQRDVHPTNVNYWNPVEVDPLEYLPEWMQEHPYWNAEVIE